MNFLFIITLKMYRHFAGRQVKQMTLLMMFSLNDANFLLKRKVFCLIGKTLP